MAANNTICQDSMERAPLLETDSKNTAGLFYWGFNEAAGYCPEGVYKQFVHCRMIVVHSNGQRRCFILFFLCFKGLNPQLKQKFDNAHIPGSSSVGQGRWKSIFILCFQR